LARIYTTENIASQKSEAVSPIRDGKFWQPGHISV